MSRIEWHVKPGNGNPPPWGGKVDNEGGAKELRDHWNAIGFLGSIDYRVVKVRVLTPAESRRKAAATALRELAADWYAKAQNRRYEDAYVAGTVDAIESMAADADKRADALWPRKGAGR